MEFICKNASSILSVFGLLCDIVGFYILFILSGKGLWPDIIGGNVDSIGNENKGKKVLRSKISLILIISGFIFQLIPYIITLIKND